MNSTGDADEGHLVEDAREVAYASCPKCGAECEGADLGLLEIDRSIVGKQIRTTTGVVCRSCGALVGVCSDYHRTDVAEASGATWQRMRSIDDR